MNLAHSTTNLRLFLFKQASKRRTGAEKVLNHPWFDEIGKNRKSEQKVKEEMGFGKSFEETRECQKEKIPKHDVFCRKIAPDRSTLEQF
jgi:hypothetical protein